MQEESEKAPAKKKGIPKLLLLFIVMGILFLIVGAGAASLVIKQKPEYLGLSKGQTQILSETNALVAQVGKLIALPSGEQPTVATITDISKLKDQVFFKDAKNNDRVLIYTNAKEAILYRPSENRIIQVGAVNINNSQAVSPLPSSSPVLGATATPAPVATTTPFPTPVLTPTPVSTPSPKINP